jgi:hypothetical protein
VTSRRPAPPALDPLDYPFDVPLVGYTWRSGLPPGPAAGVDEVAGRTAVLAIGSNAASSQLSRKFALPAFADPATDDGRIPVAPAAAPGIDVVFAAQVASYGSVPATITPSPGTVAHVFVTWLTPAQLDRMNETEALGRAYQFAHVPGVAVEGHDPAPVPAYAATAGAALFGGEPLASAAVAAAGRTLPAASQRAVWDRLAAAAGVPGGARALVDAVVADRDRRDAMSALLRSGRIP